MASSGYDFWYKSRLAHFVRPASLEWWFCMGTRHTRMHKVLVLLCDPVGPIVVIVLNSFGIVIWLFIKVIFILATWVLILVFNPVSNTVERAPTSDKHGCEAAWLILHPQYYLWRNLKNESQVSGSWLKMVCILHYEHLRILDLGFHKISVLTKFVHTTRLFWWYTLFGHVLIVLFLDSWYSFWIDSTSLHAWAQHTFSCIWKYSLFAANTTFLVISSWANFKSGKLQLPKCQVPLLGWHVRARNKTLFIPRRMYTHRGWDVSAWPHSHPDVYVQMCVLILYTCVFPTFTAMDKLLLPEDSHIKFTYSSNV